MQTNELSSRNRKEDRNKHGSSVHI